MLKTNIRKIVASEDTFIVRYLKASFNQVILVLTLSVFVVIIDLPLIITILVLVFLTLLISCSIRNYRRYLYTICFDGDYVSLIVKRFNRLETEVKVHISSINAEHTIRPFIQFSNDVLYIYIDNNLFIKQFVVSGWDKDKFKEICSIIKTRKNEFKVIR